MGLKTTETLLGIETAIAQHQAGQELRSQNYWNPFRDWNTSTPQSNGIWPWSQNYWNPFRDWNSGGKLYAIAPSRLKTTETLLGIETMSTWAIASSNSLVSKLLKPF